MQTLERKAARQRTNLMISVELLNEMDCIVPTGERSDFVNDAIEKALTSWSRAKAIELIRNSKKKEKEVHTTEEILKTIHADRRF